MSRESGGHDGHLVPFTPGEEVRELGQAPQQAVHVSGRDDVNAATLDQDEHLLERRTRLPRRRRDVVVDEGLDDGPPASSHHHQDVSALPARRRHGLATAGGRPRISRHRKYYPAAPVQIYHAPAGYPPDGGVGTHLQVTGPGGDGLLSDLDAVGDLAEDEVAQAPVTGMGVLGGGDFSVAHRGDLPAQPSAEQVGEPDTGADGHGAIMPGPSAKVPALGPR